MMKDFALTEEDRWDLTYNILGGNEGAAKAVEAVIAFWVSFRDGEGMKPAKPEMRAVISQGRKLKEAIDKLGECNEIDFLACGVNLGILKSQLDALEVFEDVKSRETRKGPSINRENFDLLVIMLKKKLESKDFALSVYTDNVLNNVVDFALRVTGNERKDSLNQIRACQKRHPNNF